jgi:predicted Zn-dependent protease
MRTLKPAWAFPRYLLRGGTSSAKKQARVPATVKIAFDRYFSWSLTHIHKRLARSRSLPPTLQNTMKQLARAMVISRDRRFQQRLERLLARLRPHVADAGMRSCYRVVALESQVVNAFNTGCTNYITRGLASKLTDLQLMAVLAHELSHGDQGHAVRNIGLIATSVGEHSFRLISEEIAWFLTGKWGPLLQKVLSKGHLTPILQAYGVRAPQIEIEADVGATKILLRGGYSPAALVRALQILHMGQRKPATRKPTSRPSGGVRQYPGLARRIQAIRKAWK